MADSTLPPLPPDFELEEDVPPLPPGFVMVADGEHAMAPDQPTEKMSAFDKFMAGMGRSVVETGRGLHQYGANIAADPTAAFGPLGRPILRSVLGDSIDRMVQGSSLGRMTQKYRQGVQSDIDDARRYDKDLMDSGWGQAGNATGVMLQLYGPGALSRGTAAQSALMPTTIRGNTLQGAVIGGLQPTATGESTGLNALLGGVGGGVGSALFKGIGVGGSALYNRLTGRAGASADDLAAAEMIRSHAEVPARIMTPAPSSVPGVQRSLAEEALDPGIARLERNLRSTQQGFDALDRANNSARVRAIEGFAGDEAALSAAKAARTQQTSSLLDRALQDKGVNVATVRAALDDQIKVTAPRPSVQSALLDVKRALDSAGDDVFSLYETRKYIGDLLSGKAGGDKTYAKAASRELMQLKTVLDKQLAEASPAFSDYLHRYQELSAPINRMATGQRFLDKAANSVADATDPTGARPLSAALVSRASRSLDEIAAKATGFAKAKATDILQPGDIAVIKAIQDDMERQAFRGTAGSGGGSPTFERLSLDQRMAFNAGTKIAGEAPGVGQYLQGFMEYMDKTKNDRLKERMAYLVANPAEARRVVAALPPEAQKIVTKALTQAGGAAGVAAGIVAMPDQPLEIDVIGGRVGEAPTPEEMEALRRQVYGQ